MDRRYDVPSCAPNSCNYCDIKGVLNPKFKRKFPNGPRKGDKRITNTLEDKAPLLLQDVTLFVLPDDHSDAPYVEISG